MTDYKAVFSMDSEPSRCDDTISSKEEFLEIANNYNSGKYHPDVFVQFFVDGKELDMDNFITGSNYNIIDYSL